MKPEPSEWTFCGCFCCSRCWLLELLEELLERRALGEVERHLPVALLLGHDVGGGDVDHRRRDLGGEVGEAARRARDEARRRDLWRGVRRADCGQGGDGAQAQDGRDGGACQQPDPCLVRRLVLGGVGLHVILRQWKPVGPGRPISWKPTWGRIGNAPMSPKAPFCNGLRPERALLQSVTKQPWPLLRGSGHVTAQIGIKSMLREP